MDDDSLRKEVQQLTDIIRDNRAALRSHTLSEAERAQLRLAIDQRRVRLTILVDQLASQPGCCADILP